MIGAIVGRTTAPDAGKNQAQLSNTDSHGQTTIGRQARNTNISSSATSRTSIFKSFNTREFQTLSKEALASSDDVENDALLLVLVSEWAKKDPQAALAFANETPNRSDLVFEALNQLAQQNPDEALDWISQNATDSSQRQYLLRAAYRGMATVDPEGAVAQIEQMSAGSQRDQLLSLTLNEWAKQDINAAFDWIELAEATPQLKHIYNEVMGRYIDQDPEQAATVISAMNSGDNKLSFASQIATKLAEKDVNYALDWLQTLDGNEKKYALLGVVDRWAAGPNGEEALDYVLQNSTDPNHKELFSMVAMKLARKNPDKLVDSFDNMSESEQMIAAQQLASVYSINDPERGMEWIESLATGAVRDEALKSTLSSYMYSNVSQAFELSETISNSSLRTKQMREVLATWFPVNQAAAEQALYASSVLTTEEKQALLNQIQANFKTDDYVLPAKQ